MLLASSEVHMSRLLPSLGFNALLLVMASPLAGIPIGAQEPLMDATRGGMSGARENWVRITNQQFQLQGKAQRVAAEGLTAVILMPGVEKPRHAKPILRGKDEHALLFRSILAAGFNRIVVRNPDSGAEWSAHLEQGKAILDF